MSIENQKHKWHKSFNKAINEIESCLTPESKDEDSVNFSVLANWLIDNPHDAYSYMPRGYQNYRSNPFETRDLLFNLHHALLDDGEVSFVKMKIEGDVKRVFMIFVSRHEDNFEAICKQENADTIRSFISGRESLRRVKLGMQEKYPEKVFDIKPSFTEKDFIFEAHRDPIAFINEVETYELERQESIKKTDELMKKIRGNKP